MGSESHSFLRKPLKNQIRELYEDGSFIMSIRYYGYKVNLYQWRDSFFEVFYNHKLDRIDKIEVLDENHSRMKFYLDQIKISF